MTDVPLPALQAALAGEHAALWACGRAAGRLSGAERTRALGQLDAHRRARDALRRRVIEAGGQPVEAAPAYLEPTPVTSAATARALLAHIATAMVAVHADLAAATTGRDRAEAVADAVGSARDAVAWGAPATAFPGAVTTSADQPSALPTERDQS